MEEQANESVLSIFNEELKPRKNLPHLLQQLTDRKPERLHYLGVSYGITGPLYAFWCFFFFFCVMRFLLSFFNKKKIKQKNRKKSGFFPAYVRQTTKYNTTLQKKYKTTQHNTTYKTKQHNTTKYKTTQHYKYNTTQHNKMQNKAAQHNTTKYNAAKQTFFSFLFIKK